MILEEFQVFMKAINESLDLAKQAYSETDELKSSELWRDVFGEQFPLYDQEETDTARSQAITIPLGNYSHAKPLPWPENLHKRFKVRLDAYLCDYNSKKELGGINSNGRVIRSGLRIKYIAKTNVGGEYEVCWQVVNTGKHAEIENGLRGEFFKARYWDGDPSNNPLMNWEYSKYTGKHWIECFIVKNNECIARSGKFFVNIKNPDFQ